MKKDISDNPSVKFTPYAAECVKVLFDSIKDSFKYEQLEIEERKELAAKQEIIEVIVVKIKQKLAIPNPRNKPFKIKLKNYQAYYFAKFLFVNRHEFKNKLEQVTLYNLAVSIDGPKK